MIRFDIDIFERCLCIVGGAFGGNRGMRPVPPEKGVFPLDHMHLCDIVSSESQRPTFVFVLFIKCCSK